MLVFQVYVIFYVVIASSGAGRVEDFSAVFKECKVEAALAAGIFLLIAGIFHRNEVSITDVKQHLKEQGYQVRL